MSRRVVRESWVQPTGDVKSRVVSIVSNGGSLGDINDGQKYFKRNYLDALRKLIPELYFNDEREVLGEHISYQDQVINSHILAAKNISTILPVSSLPDSSFVSSVGTTEGFARFFYKQTRPNLLASDDFERDFLYPLGTKYSDYKTSEEFASYISGTFLPKIPVQTFTSTDDLASLTSNAFASDSSGTHEYLINHLGWVYFLNRAGPVGTSPPFDPSGALTELLTETLWRGKALSFVDCLNIFQEYLWRHKETLSISDTIIPIDYVSGSTTEDSIHTSGTQLLDRLKTLNEVVYSPQFLDATDFKVRETFEFYLSTSAINGVGTLLDEVDVNGPLVNFLQAMSFSIADRISEDNEINILYDIGKCPDQYLELLAELIGWRLIGADVGKWRVQLRNAVQIYKQKGTKASIQTLLNLIFSAGVFNIATDTEKLFELWESYVPDLLYYALASKSAALINLETYTPALARQFGVTIYSQKDLETNIKLLVDKILFDLMLEFPESFFLGNNPYPTPKLTLLPKIREDRDGAGNSTQVVPKEEEVWFGPYHIVSTGRGSYKYMTGSKATPDSEELRLWFDPKHTYEYRGKVNYVPPFEKRQFYSQANVTPAMLERIEYYLKCYGVEDAFAESLTKYVKDNNSYSTDAATVINNFMLYTRERKYAPNYAEVIKAATKNRDIDPVSLLTLWNGKSSHFLISLEASSFDFSSRKFNSDGVYGLRKLKSVVNEVAPAHAIPNILLTVSDVTDSASGVQDNPCFSIAAGFDSLYGVNSYLAGHEVSAVNMEALASTPKRFKRVEVDNINDPLLASGVTNVISVPRNTLRRRNFRNLLPENKMYTRNGTGSPGKLELSSSFQDLLPDERVVSLGFIASSLKFAPVPFSQSTIDYGIGTLLDHKSIPDVWNICENLHASSTFYGVDTSHTFPYRERQNLTSSDCVSYGKRSELPEILSTMHRLNEQKHYVHASSIISGYYNDDGSINTRWPTTSDFLEPKDLSSWASNQIDLQKSIGNYLLNTDQSSFSITDLEHFEFGRKLHSLYKDYSEIAGNYKKHVTNSNYDLVGGPNVFSHTFGPYLYNHNLDVDGSAVTTAPYLQASSAEAEADISFYDGSGVLSEEGIIRNVGTYGASTTADLYIGRPEFRNEHLVSGIELVDTSSASDRTASHPIFSIFKLSRKEQSKYKFVNYLVNNTLLKYQRPVASDKFPRIRVKLDNSDLTDNNRNFLTPNHEYEVRVTAHNLDTNSNNVGGQSLSLWVHTEPENGHTYSYVAKPYECIPDEIFVRGFDFWQRNRETYFTNSAGFSHVRSLSQSVRFSEGTLDAYNTSSNSDIISPAGRTVDYRCFVPITTVTDAVVNPNPAAIINISEKTREQITFKFRTVDSPVTELTSEYQRTYGNVHRVDQKYVLELFLPTGDDSKFVVIEKIELVDLTNKRKAVVSSQYGEVSINVEDMRAIFRYFNTLQAGMASRDSYQTSATLDVSGGSKLNYRSNIGMYTATTGGNEQLTEITIIEG